MSKENKFQELHSKIQKLMVGSCTCGTITNNPQMHSGYCMYFKLSVILDYIEDLNV